MFDKEPVPADLEVISMFSLARFPESSYKNARKKVNLTHKLCNTDNKNISN